jgi:hypothetical protein
MMSLNAGLGCMAGRCEEGRPEVRETHWGCAGDREDREPREMAQEPQGTMSELHASASCRRVSRSGWEEAES